MSQSASANEALRTASDTGRGSAAAPLDVAFSLPPEQTAEILSSHLDQFLDVPLSYVLLCDREQPWRLCMRQGRHGSYGFAGGKLALDESPRNGAKRELLEETGLKARKKELVLLGEFHMPGFSTVWPVSTAKEHGYATAGKLKDPNKDHVVTIHSKQTFFFLPINPEDAPKKFDGRQYSWISLADKGALKSIQRRFHPVIDVWGDTLESMASVAAFYKAAKAIEVA